MTNSTAGGRMRVTGPRVSSIACRLAAALLATAAAAGQSVGAADGPDVPKGSSGTIQTEGAATPAPRVERHSPRTGYPSLGPAGAKNTLIFFTDYQCPVCPRAARELDQLVENFNGTLRVELHHNPLVMHKNAYDAAAAAKAAQRQGKFWEYHEELLKSRSFSRDTLIGIAAGLGLDRETFIRDFDDPKLRLEVTAEAKQAYEADANGTPGFLINGHVEVGWASLPWLEGVVRAHSR
jgi:protein-disulfide isomerase